MKSAGSIGHHLYYIFLVFMTVLLIVAGALVTSNDAGLAAPDWPLSYGQVNPRMVGGLFYEHGHRIIASTVGFLTLIGAIWMVLKESRKWVRRVALLSLASVGLQGILGGMTVLFGLPLLVSVLHACLAQIFLCIVVSLALFTSPKWEEHTQSLPKNSSHTPVSLSVATTGFIFLQLILGAALRHTEVYQGFTLVKAVYGAPLLVIAHITGALFVITMIIVTSYKIFREHSGNSYITRPAMILIGLVSIQFILGLAAYMVRLLSQQAPQPLTSVVAITAAHVTGGALTLALQWALTVRLMQCSPKVEKSLFAQEERIAI